MVLRLQQCIRLRSTISQVVTASIDHRRTKRGAVTNGSGKTNGTRSLQGRQVTVTVAKERPAKMGRQQEAALAQRILCSYAAGDPMQDF